ncbi:MAG: hypothetical protein ACE5FU_03710, partial [Nitrospinota bacterium]
LFYFYGYMELAEGQKDGVQRMVQGVFHKNRLEGVLFRQGPLSIRYNGKELVEMKSSLVLESPEGLKVSADVQFLQPFKWSGYDVYIHRERGYAVELEYTDQLKRKRGFVDFPDYIRNPSKQTKYFDIPGEDLGFVGSLNIPEGLVKKGKWALEIPENASLTLERGGEEFTLNPGASAQLKQGGSITFLGISRWANYVIYKNSFGIVLAGSGLLAVVALFCHMLYQTQKKKGATGFQLWN